MHLPIHLVDEVKLSGPVHGWSMFSIERYLGKLKSNVRNRSRPEGSIAEGYLAEECLVFCSRYLKDAQQHSQEFMFWLKEKVELDQDQVPPYIKWLSLGPCNVARRYVGYIDHNPVTEKVLYYGVIQEIIELDYWSSFSVVLFRCDWFHVENDDYGFARVNFNKNCYSDDPFVLASQVHQVFYVEDPIEEGWHYTIKNLPKELFGFGETEEAFLVEPNEVLDDMIGNMVNDSDDVRWCREDIPHTVVDMHGNTFPNYSDYASGENHGNEWNMAGTNLSCIGP
ncbi:glutamine-tRNA ligase [Striga asiatica]|uniref:Glutamine-tRNA ligase n=1 Tax=Striga asiatica TaxID=4170 RepID=A0A5A7Q545_STRAF|nr:glutamine-tRNA ligase [Striga asiatica]